jgi:hypothetical protein
LRFGTNLPIFDAAMVGILQIFEFSYGDGYLFNDRSGQLAQRLKTFVPGLVMKASVHDQLDFVGTDDLELFYGISLARIQTVYPDRNDFTSIAARFLQALAEVFEIKDLRGFRYRYVLAKPCESREAANKLMWTLIPQETTAKMQSVAAPIEWDAVQGEFRLGNFQCFSRTATVEIVPHAKIDPVKARSGSTVPFVATVVDLHGLAPIPIAEFDALTFMNNIRDKHSKEILSKLAPEIVTNV